MFDADHPIVSSQQDRLGRTTFAKYLARCILDHLNPASLVVGLYGGWGVGKTSVINLTLEELRVAASNMFDDEKPIILNFSPWSYAGQNQLIYSFFRRLSAELSRAEFLEHKEKIIGLLELYVSFFTHKPVPKILRPRHSIFAKIFRRQLLASETFGWESGHDLTQVKAELNALLQHQKHKLIIIIDNISRLDAFEIKQIFQIVKSMGNYSNTVYILALDKNHTLDVLGQEIEGEAYLEKIIQVPFEIPAISSQDIEAIFIDRLNQLLPQVPLGAWDKNYWADLYYAALKYFFTNVRDISRYINTLSFSYVHVRDVVNPVDFFAITALEIFAPQVYAGIRENKDLFTDLMDDVYRLDARNVQEDKSRCDEILQRGQKIPREILVPLLVRLFPRLRSLYESKIPFYHSEVAARNNYRICSPDIFDVYFRLSMPLGMIPKAEMHAILAMSNDAEGFGLALLRLNQDGQIERFLALLDSVAVVDIPLVDVGNVINALIDGADLFPEGEDSPVSFTTAMRIHRIIHQLLQRFDNKKRMELLRDAIKNALHSLYIIVHELTVQQEENNETSDTILPLEQRDFDLNQLQVLKKLAVSKIAYWAEVGRLIEHPKLLPILYAWKQWGDEEECRRYVSLMTQEDKGLLAFLGAALKVPVDEAIAKLEVRQDWKNYLINIEAFIPISALEPHAVLMFEDLEFEKLREREQLAVLIFLDLIHAKTVKIIPKTTI